MAAEKSLVRGIFRAGIYAKQAEVGSNILL